MKPVNEHLEILMRCEKGLILGEPGSGVTFTAKSNILNVLETGAKCIIIDPESEHSAFAKAMGGEEIKIKPGGKWHINPMEITPGIENVSRKVYFISKLMEVNISAPFGLNSVQKTIIDECVRSLYAPFIEDGELQPIPPEKMPTLTDLQEVVTQKEESEAKELSYALRRYTGTGFLNIFGSQSNVDTENQFVVYSIREMEMDDELKPVAMMIILEYIKNKLSEERDYIKNTWIWIDSFDLLLRDESIENALSSFWHRARVNGYVPVGISRDVETVLKSVIGRSLLSDCNYIQLFRQSAPNCKSFRDLLCLSDSQVAVITQAPKGQGLICDHGNISEFRVEVPSRDSILYRLLTSV